LGYFFNAALSFSRVGNEVGDMQPSFSHLKIQKKRAHVFQ
jgi:hypothetical protein